MAFIDKINPDVPEGRLLIRNGDYVLKDPEAKVSSIPLDKKWERLLKYIKDKGYSTKEIDRMISAYSLVYKRRAARNIDQYNEIVKDYPLLNFQLRSLLLYDYYDMLPMNRKIYYSAYYELNDNFRNLLDDCMRTAKSMHVRDLTISVEASSCASFFEYLQKLGLKDIYDIQEEHVRKYMIYNKCKTELTYRIGLFIRRHGEFIGITPKMTEKAISQIESTSLRGISAKWKGNAKLEDLDVSNNMAERTMRGHAMGRLCCAAHNLPYVGKLVMLAS